jgi:hypothetical protein
MPTRSRGINELGRERPHPAADRDVVDLDAPIGEQLLHVAVGQATAQITAHPAAITPPGNGEPAGIDEPDPEPITRAVSRQEPTGQRNKALERQRLRGPWTMGDSAA